MLLAGVMALSAPGVASADFTIRVYLDGVQQGSDIAWDGTTTDVFGAAEIDYSKTFTVGSGKVNVTFTASTSNSQGGLDSGTIARIDIGGVQIGNTDTKSHTFEIIASDAFNFPGTPGMFLHTTASGTATNTTANGNTSVSIVGGVGNTSLFDTSIVTSTKLTATFPKKGVSFSDAGNLNTDFDSSKVSFPYILTNDVSFTINAGSNINDAGGTAEVTTPVPAGLALIFSGVPFLGAWHWLRRRKK